MIHATVKERLENVGYGYEKMQRTAAALKENLYGFFGKTQDNFPKYIQMNNLQADLENEKALSIEELDKRNDVIDEMSKCAVAFLPLMEIMITDSKTRMDAIFDYEETFVKDFKELADNKEDEKKSLKIMQKIEADYEPLVENLKIIEERLITATKNVAHLEALYQKLT